MGLARFIGFSAHPPAATASLRAVAVERAVSLCHELVTAPDEDAGLAEHTLECYRALDASERLGFFDRLAAEFSPDPEAVGRFGDAYRLDASPEHLARLLKAAEPPRRELFRRLNLARGGTAALVEMRRQLLLELHQHPSWRAIDSDLSHLLAGWFHRGFLTLRRIDWNTPAVVLEKLIAYEAVHPIQGWRDLRRRLEADRRCYAFFHPALPDEPVIFIEIALTRGMSAGIRSLLDPDSPVTRPENANCATFYSITNSLEGLRGVPFGSFLIRAVADQLAREFPRVRLLATVSPIPGFLNWLTAQVRAQGQNGHETPLQAIVRKLQVPRWFTDPELCAELQRDLMPLCAFYLLHAKHGQEPQDSVGRFHLRNGARLERVNWLADTSETAIQRSAGLMANYVYRLPEVRRNHERYAAQRIQASGRMERLAKDSLLGRVRAIR